MLFARDEPRISDVHPRHAPIPSADRSSPDIAGSARERLADPLRIIPFPRITPRPSRHVQQLAAAAAAESRGRKLPRSRPPLATHRARARAGNRPHFGALYCVSLIARHARPARRWNYAFRVHRARVRVARSPAPPPPPPPPPPPREPPPEFHPLSPPPPSRRSRSVGALRRAASRSVRSSAPRTR